MVFHDPSQSPLIPLEHDLTCLDLWESHFWAIGWFRLAQFAAMLYRTLALLWDAASKVTRANLAPRFWEEFWEERPVVSRSPAFLWRRWGVIVHKAPRPSCNLHQTLHVEALITRNHSIRPVEGRTMPASKILCVLLLSGLSLRDPVGAERLSHSTPSPHLHAPSRCPADGSGLARCRIAGLYK
jgi:hypothetical protein